MVDVTISLWLEKVRLLCTNTPERREAICRTNSATGISNGWPFDYMEAAQRHLGRYLDGRLEPDRIQDFLRGLFCIVTISNALRYLEQQDTRDEEKVTRSPIPPLCYAKLLSLTAWHEMVGLMAELAEHIELASTSEWENDDLGCARLLREQAEMIRTVSREEIERALEAILK